MKFLYVAVVVAALAVLDVSLERMERLELASTASGYEQRGLRLLNQNRPLEAVELLRQAHTMERRNWAYQLALVEGLTAAGKFSEAEVLLNEALTRSSNNGAANLAAARLMGAKGDLEQAESYYHRAIFGAWAQGGEAARRKVRLELVDYLAVHGKFQALLAELIGLDAETGIDRSTKRRVADLFLLAGSPARAAQTYQSLLAKEGADASLYKHLGEAKLATGDYGSALGNFLRAFRLSPNDIGIRRRMEVASSMASLDPTPRRLSTREKYRRSLRILALAEDRYAQCTGAGRDTSHVAEAPGQMTNELTESRLAQAEQIWKDSLLRCGPSITAKEEPLRLIMLKLVQQ